MFFSSPAYDFPLIQNTSTAARGKKGVHDASWLLLEDSNRMLLQKKLRWSTVLGKKSVTQVPPQLKEAQFRGIGVDGTGRRIWLEFSSHFVNTNITYVIV